MERYHSPMLSFTNTPTHQGYIYIYIDMSQHTHTHKQTNLYGLPAQSMTVPHKFSSHINMSLEQDESPVDKTPGPR